MGPFAPHNPKGPDRKEFPRKSAVFPRNSQIGSKKTNKQKTHKHFSDGPCGTIVPGTNPHPSQGQTGQNGDFTVELNRERPVCPGDGSHFVPGRGPICPRDGSCLSRTPSCRKCLCLLVFFFPRKSQSLAMEIRSFKSLRSRPGKPNQRKGQNKKFMNFAHFCEFWGFSLGRQARFTSNFLSGMPL